MLDPKALLTSIGLHEGQTVADFGCGMSGHFVFPAAQLVEKTGRVFAIDIQKPVISSIESHRRLIGAANVEPLWGDIERAGGVRVKDFTFDVSLLVNNLYLVRDRDALGQELARTTKPGGVLLVIDWVPSTSPIGPAMEQRVTPQAAQELFTRCGFILDHSLEPGQYHWGLLFKKSS